MAKGQKAEPVKVKQEEVKPEVKIEVKRVVVPCVAEKPRGLSL